MTTRAFLVLVALAVVNGGCSRSPKSSPPTTAAVTAVSLFDCAESSHPSPRDSRWTITNQSVKARIRSVARSEAAGPSPTCPAVVTIELVDVSSVTNRFLVIHIHIPSSIRLEGPGGEFIVSNGEELLRGLADSGIPTNKFFAPSPND